MDQSSLTKAKQKRKKGWKGLKGKGNKKDKNRCKGMHRKEEELNRLRKKRALQVKDKMQSSVVMVSNRLKKKGSRSKMQGIL